MGAGDTVASVRRRRIGALATETHSDRAAMGAAAAADAALVLADTIARTGQARAVFASAPSQAEVLAHLRMAPGIDWTRVTAFHLDEYVGLPEGASERFAVWLERHLFDQVPVGRVHLLRPDPDPEAEAHRYGKLLAEAPIDLVCCGIGVNGHLAFNDPPVADFADPLAVKTVELDRLCRQQQVDDGCFPRFEDVPTHAVTLTIPRILNAGRIVCAVPGRAKRAAVARLIAGPVGTDCPATILAETPHARLYLDPEADPDGAD